MFVMNCKVVEDEVLRYEPIGKKKKKQQQGKLVQCHKMNDSLTSVNDGTSTERYHPVTCVECSSEVAVYDRDEVYHFFNVLASHAWSLINPLFNKTVVSCPWHHLKFQWVWRVKGLLGSLCVFYKPVTDFGSQSVHVSLLEKVWDNIHMWTWTLHFLAWFVHSQVVELRSSLGTYSRYR